MMNCNPMLVTPFGFIRGPNGSLRHAIWWIINILFIILYSFLCSEAVDKIDALEKTVKALTRDLETTMTESINNKQSALGIISHICLASN